MALLQMKLVTVLDTVIKIWKIQTFQMKTNNYDYE